MRIGKILITITGIMCLLICSIFSVTAEELETLEDGKDDVLVMDELMESLNTTDEKPNIDIKKLTYSKSDGEKKATLILEVYGQIENRGSMDDELGFLDSVAYIIALQTSEKYYEITYINQKCQVISDTIEENITDFTINGGVLTINFDLDASSETYEDMTAESMDINLDLSGGGAFFIDTVPDEYDSLFTVDAGGPYEGEVGEEIDFSGEVYLGISPYSYSWDFGDGETSTERNPSHVYNSPGEYTLTFTVTDSTEASQNDITTVTISEKQIPNGTGDQESGSALIIFIAIIAIIVIIGIIVLILILRR